MIKTWAFYIIYLFFSLFIFSQEFSENLNNKSDTLLPGFPTSIPFILQNTSTEDKIYEILISTSNKNIQPILTKNEFKISALEKAVYIVPLKISSETEQGNYSIKLEAFDKATHKFFTETKEINIAKKQQISLVVLNYPNYVKAGDTIRASFLLKNIGNVTETLNLKSINAIIDENSNISLAPKESKIINIHKVTDPDIKQNEYQNLNLSVDSHEFPKGNQNTYITTRIISTKPSEKDVYHRFPITTSASFIGMENMRGYNNGFQGEIYGKGSLDEKNKNQIEFRALTSNPIEFNSFVQYEEYFINYKKDNLFLHLGDKTYSASYLTEFARYGRGAELQYKFKTISLGGFYNRPRFFRDIKEEFNIYSTFKIRDNSEIKIGFFQKDPRLNENNFGNIRLNSKANLPYATGKFNISENINISGEVAYSKSKELEGTAYMIQTQYRFKKFDGNFTYMRSSPEFAGYFNNTSTFNGNFQYKISKKLYVFSNYTKDAKNFQRDTLNLTAPYRDFFQYGIQYKYLQKGSIMFFNGFQKYQDRLEPKQFDYYEKFFKVSVNQQIGIFQINLEGQLGKTDNYLTGFNGNSRLYTANISFEKFKTSFNIFTSYATTSRYQLKNQEQIYYGARILSRLSDKTNFSIFYQNNYMPEEYFKSRNLFEILYHQELFKGHELDISGRYALERGKLGNKDYIFSLRYTFRLNMPIKKIAEYTSLSGNISNLGVEKIDGIKLRLGNHISVTDKNGNYTFKNIIPGDYFLEIDRSTLNINDVTDTYFPKLLTLDKQVNVFSFGITNSANIKGTIVFDGKKENIATETKNKKSESVIVEVSDNEQTYRKIVSLGENFDFTYLQPGNWKIKIYKNGLDKRYKIAIDTFDLNLKPSEIFNLKINVSKQQNEIKYQQNSIKVEYNNVKK